jgi:hypothetical protein
MSPAEQVTVSTSTVSETTITSSRFSITFVVVTSDGATRWSIAAAIKPAGLAAGQRIERAIESLADPSMGWSSRTTLAWACSGTGWSDRHQAIVELAEALAMFGAEGSGDA